VTRTPSNHLPIYTLRKAGGNKPVTRVKKVDGRAEVLRDELRELLGLADKEVVINKTTGHIMIKGHHVSKIEHFLRQRAF
jgi:large subunit ribosomal protein L49